MLLKAAEDLSIQTGLCLALCCLEFVNSVCLYDLLLLCFIVYSFTVFIVGCFNEFYLPGTL